MNFAPETEGKLTGLATQTGRSADELVQDAVDGYVGELADLTNMLNSRYDDLQTGRAQPIPGDEIEAYFREKSVAARRSQPGL